MADTPPFFTILTPTYNRAGTLHRVYESLCQQTFKDFEWVVVDDGSTDNTHASVLAWQARAAFPIRYVWQNNQHKKTAFNRGVREARGELIVGLTATTKCRRTRCRSSSRSGTRSRPRAATPTWP